MKKTLLSVLAAVSVIGVASAVPSVEDRKAMCEKYPEKYIWVANSAACIPINPCKSDNTQIKDTYCNRVFSDVQTHGGLYKGLIELYAETYGLQCTPVEQQANSYGQDYVLCKGNDVMVFEFDDINDGNFGKSLDFYDKLAKGLCDAVSGNFNDGICEGANETNCGKINKVIKKYELEKVGDDLGGNILLQGAWYVPAWGGCSLQKGHKQHDYVPTLGELAPNYDSSDRFYGD